MSQRLSDTWAVWINEALPKIAVNDRAKWELTLVVVQTPEGVAGVAFLLLVVLPSPVVGVVLQDLLQVSNPAGASKDAVVELLRAMVDRLRIKRSQELLDAASEGSEPNGAGPPGPRRLIVPGQ